MSSVEVEYKLASETSTVEIKGANNLKAGLNKIEVKVTEKNGTVTSYIIDVNNTITSGDIAERNNSTWLVIIIILSVLLVIETIYIIIKRKKDSK